MNIMEDKVNAFRMYSEPIEAEQAAQYVESIIDREIKTMRAINILEMGGCQYWESLQSKRIEKIIRLKYPDSDLTRKQIIDPMLKVYKINISK